MADNTNSGIIWKLVITALVLAWALLAMMPFSDTPFEEFIKTRATAHQEEFSQLLQKAEASVDKANYKSSPDKYPTLYIALREYSDKHNIDLFKYFPDIAVGDIKILKKRNDILMKELYRQSKGALKKGLDLQGGVSFTLEIDDSGLDSNSEARKGQLDDVLTVLNNRINGLGVTEPIIRVVGGNSIEVQMPGVSLKDNPEAIEELSRPAKLDFRLVYRGRMPSSAKPHPSEIPAGYEVMVMESERQGKLVEIPMFVKKLPEAGGDIIKHAAPAMEDMSRFSVSMEFTSEGSKTIERVTRQIIEEDRRTGTKQQLAIVLDGRLMSAPTVQTVLLDRGSITGDFTRREAIELANALNNPLSVGLKRTSISEVGPSLAAEARDSSIMSAVIGGALVILFMVLYYFGMGLIATFTVIVNVLIIVGVLASLNATMTLPGIAALVLTMGMAVDANILVFERMREELKAGKSMWSALMEGYDKAFSTIVDANLTTLLVAVILYIFGTGPVKGFGLILSIGIFTTLFCALVLSKALLQIAVKCGMLKGSLKFRILTGDEKVDFMKYAKVSFILSWTVVLLGVCALVYSGKRALSIDFTGGEVMTISFEEKPPINEILSLSGSSFSNLGEIQASYKTDISSGKEYLSVQVETDKSDLVFDTLAKKFPNSKLSLSGKDSIGAAVSSDITRNAFLSVGLALLGMLLYVAIRFEIGYGIGAVVSSLHDVLLTIGLYVILGIFGIGTGQFSSSMVAAILMVVGYSINDKIIIFDRIREELKLRPQMTLREVINYSINKTLARTLITSITTFVAAAALFLFGTGIIVDFSLVFILGILTGTFSSIFIASPVLYWWHKGSRARIEKESDKDVVHEWEE